MKHRRWLVRLATAYSAVAVAALATLLVAMLLDWLLDMSMPQRLVAMGICFGTVLWVFYRYALPWLGHRESEVDMALLIEREERIDTDLVAALEFESPVAPTWGSASWSRR